MIDYIFSDGTVRVFTSDPARMGNSDVLEAFEQEVGKTAIATQQDLGGMKISELPGQESLLKEGKKDGETKMVREGDQVGCYSWSAAEQKWNKIGDVVGASGATQNTSGKVLHEGKVRCCTNCTIRCSIHILCSFAALPSFYCRNMTMYLPWTWTDKER